MNREVIESLGFFEQQYLTSLKKELQDIQERILLLERSNIRSAYGVSVIKRKAQEKDFTNLKPEDLEIVIRKCSNCKLEQSINNFHICKNGKFGRHASCKKCTAQKREHKLEREKIN
jgi:predicted nuclease of restriction endonuclease-like RecB superfamily